ncbi:MAG: hypothetical protein ACO1QB_08990 [Verrucomicrobiales bacterium]
MKILITIVIIAAVYFLGNTIRQEVKKKEKKEAADEQRERNQWGSDGLPGMDRKFEPSLKEAEAQGAAALKSWLERYASHLQDPKLADIQLSYAVMIARTNPAEAKRIYQAIKARTPTTSPIYDRVKKLGATFG